VGNYDTSIRRVSARSRVSSRYNNRNTWAASTMAQSAESSGWAGRAAGRDFRAPHRSGRRREDFIVPLGIAFVVFLCVTLYILATLVSQSFEPPQVRQQASGAAVGSGAGGLNAAADKAGPGGQTKILLLGSDQRPEDGSFRTDVIILLVLDPDQMTLSAVSFPRDLWVQVPGLYEMKINQVHEIGGFEATAEMFQANFGVKPDYYLLTNFNGFTQFIDNRGGIDVEVEQELTDSCDLPQSRGGICSVEPGIIQMDGATALWYIRSRNTSNDFDRLRRAQEVVYAVVKKVANFKTVGQFAKMKEELGENVETNMSPQKVVSLLPAAVRLLDSPERIKRYAIGEEQAVPTYSWNGMWILLPDLDAIRGLLREAGINL
jgi:polyisoprenyl-teichoic acid--peptidoglycan teichoic acid transferase